VIVAGYELGVYVEEELNTDTGVTGVTLLDEPEAAEVPLAFVAVTVNV
jgi:hypothetical protein